jgi:uncharacterized spore protein YtfJ
MNAKEMLEKVQQSLGSAATARSVFGEPIEAQGKTIVPVAKVAYGFGAGYGEKPGRHRWASAKEGEGGGGGGGVAAFPVGVLEITPVSTRFVPFMRARVLVGTFVAGFLIGRLLSRRRRIQREAA